MELTKELIAKARACKTEEELKALAKENGIEIPEEEIKMILSGNAEGELAEEELEAVSGGQKGCKKNSYKNVLYNTKDEVEFIFNIGDVAQAYLSVVFGNETATVRITERGVFANGSKWQDLYKYDRISGSPTLWGFEWQKRDRFEK